MKITKPGIDTKNPPSFVGVTVTCSNCGCIAILDGSDIVFPELVQSSQEGKYWKFITDCLTENCGSRMIGVKRP